MCLAIPSRVIEVNKDAKFAKVETMGAVQNAALDLADEPIEAGDYVLLHVGFVIRKIAQDEALETINIFKELGTLEIDKKENKA
jgi:hydrogenase expression/formation protein HypC